MSRCFLFFILAGMISVCVSCTRTQTAAEQDLRTAVAPQIPAGESRVPLATLITLDPGHFHAALVQKSMYPQIAPTVYVYAPPGDELADHLRLIESYNSRSDNPTRWKEEVYTGQDFAARAFSEKKGNVLVLAGDNKKKIEYIQAGVEAKLNVFSDKPMCLDAAGYGQLKEAFQTARQNDVLLYDIMTERYEIATILQKELSQIKELFGELKAGSPDDPAIVKQSVHHFFKMVSGSPLKRPPWFFDTDRQGEGIVDVTTHLVDLILWEAFPEQPITVADVAVLAADRWPTVLTSEQFRQVTQTSDFPPSLKSRLKDDGTLPCYANGQIDFTVRGIHARAKVEWAYQSAEGSGDTHYSIMKGTRANLVIRQGLEENYRPELYVEPAEGLTVDDLGGTVFRAALNLQRTRPGVLAHKEGDHWRIIIPDRYRVGHEAHFSQVTEKFLAYLREGKLPDWEISNMLTKYYITTTALELARLQ